MNSENTPKGQTIEMLADWILKNRNEHVLVGDTKESIALGIQEDIKHNNILYVYDDNEMDFIGVVSFMPDRENEILFVRNLLITKHGTLEIFVRYFQMQFPNYRIAANRKNQYMEYNYARIVNLLPKIINERNH